MIEKIGIAGYRRFRDVTVSPHPKLNFLVGDNEAGRSTILEALGLAFTCRVNGRPASDELNPYWLNREIVGDFFAQRARGEKPAPPEIVIEVFFTDSDELQPTRRRRCRS